MRATGPPDPLVACQSPRALTAAISPRRAGKDQGRTVPIVAQWNLVGCPCRIDRPTSDDVAMRFASIASASAHALIAAAAAAVIATFALPGSSGFLGATNGPWAALQWVAFYSLLALVPLSSAQIWLTVRRNPAAFVVIGAVAVIDLMIVFGGWNTASLPLFGVLTQGIAAMTLVPLLKA